MMVDKSRQLQRRLYLVAKKSGSRRFHALFDRLSRPDVLWRAGEEVRSNGGSAGIDGVSLAEVERRGVTAFLREIAQQLEAGSYRPEPVRRVYIPKPDGRRRPLGIPTVRDRVVQQACRLVIEPIFEADFAACSYGFRPKRSAHDAVRAVKEAMVRGWYVLDADITSYFDRIDHEVLMHRVEERISDRRVLKLLRQWLKAGVVEEGRWQPSEVGAPQGGVISPLLANIYLHVLDERWTTTHARLGRLTRYADDFVIVCRTRRDAEKARAAVEEVLTELKLELHPEKTRMVEVKREGFEFLGFHFRKVRSKRSGKLFPIAWPSQRAMKAVRAKLRAETRRSTLRTSAEAMVAALNPIIRGWASYFRVGNATRQLQQLDRYVWMRLRRWLQTRLRRVPEELDRWMNQLGVAYFYRPGIGSRRLRTP